MYKRSYLGFVAIALITPALLTTSYAQQTWQRAATMRGGGNGRDGKCTLEVVVDGVAEIEIRGASSGNTAVMRNLDSQPPSWRRFECSGVMPSNPADFRFQGIDGRGRQTLVRDPRQGGVAIVRIEDPQGGSEGYTFDILWNMSGGGYMTQNAPPRSASNPPASNPPAPNYDRGAGQYPPPPPPPPPGGRGDWDRFHDERRDFGRDDWRGHIFERVRDDLRHVQAESFSGGSDLYRFGQAFRQLDELQRMLADRRYDQRELDDVIGAVQNVVRANRMEPRDRDMLSADLDQLRDFRAHHGEWGVR